MKVRIHLTGPLRLTLLVGAFAVTAPAEDAGDPLQYEQHALLHSGDALRGKRLFEREQGTACLTCHRVSDRGGNIGPELTFIGGKFDRPHLIESLLQPSRQIVEGFRTSVLLMSDGTLLTGLVREQNATTLKLYDAEGRHHRVLCDEIAEQAETDVSLMPAGLHNVLSPAEFTDLIAYLETLRPDGASRFGGGVAGPLSAPPGYSVQVIATGLDAATALETLPDGRILICEQTGALRVVEGARLLESPAATFAVDSRWERGLIGVTVDPQFPAKPYVYICRVVAEPYPHHRISRLRMENNLVDPDSEEVLLCGDDQSKMGGKVPAGHQGGGIHFGPDGCLYIGIGEQTAGAPAQQLETFLGKILRIHRDGSIPEDNPFLGATTGKYGAIWARGCRNPYTFAIRHSDGLMLINDVGGRFEEINCGRAGANFGWPLVEHGPQTRPARQEAVDGPLHWYPQSSIAGGDFDPLTGDYYFADFVQGWIRRLTPESPDRIEDFAAGLRRPVDLRFASDGSLYVLLRNAWVIDEKFQGGTGTLLKFSRRHEADD